MVALDKNGQGYWTFEEEKLTSGMETLIRFPEGGTITKAMHAKIFIPTYTKFSAAQGSECRQFMANRIVNVWRDYEDKTVNVKFDNGDWWHFTRNGEWY